MLGFCCALLLPSVLPKVLFPPVFGDGEGSTVIFPPFQRVAFSFLPFHFSGVVVGAATGVWVFVRPVYSISVRVGGVPTCPLVFATGVFDFSSIDISVIGRVIPSLGISNICVLGFHVFVPRVALTDCGSPMVGLLPGLSLARGLVFQ